MKNKHRGFVSLIIIIAILAISGASFYFYKSQKSLMLNKSIKESTLISKTVSSIDISQIPNLNPSGSKQEICEQGGGKWMSGDVRYGGQRCIKSYTDAGKKCTNSDQCLGDCVTNITSNLGKEGVCQKSTNDELCFNPVENKKFECLLGDIMINCDNQRWDFQCDSLLKDKVFFK